MIPPNYEFQGDKDAAIGLTGFAQWQIDFTHKLKDLKGLKQLQTQKQVMMADGRIAEITVASIFNRDMVVINVPPIVTAATPSAEEVTIDDTYVLIFETLTQPIQITFQPNFNIFKLQPSIVTLTPPYFKPFFPYYSASDFMDLPSNYQSHFVNQDVHLDNILWKLNCLSGYDKYSSNIWACANTGVGASGVS